ncbi:MAG: PKD domain-containing protein [Flavitalea sp.]
MKKIVKILILILLAGYVSFISCKKERAVFPVRNNNTPVANAGSDTTITLPVNSVTLNGDGSTDTDNNISGYSWTKVSGPASFNIITAQAVQTLITSLVEGVYLFELKVTDNTNLFSKDTVKIIVHTKPLEPSNGKTIKARVVEYGTNLPIAGATLFVCTAPVDNACAKNYLGLTTDNNGECIFNADSFRYGWGEKTGYWQNIFEPCFNSYFRNGTLLNNNDNYQTADSFIVKMVPKTDFTLHIIDSSLRGPTLGNYLTTDVNFNICSVGGIVGVNLRKGIDTIIQCRSCYGNATYIFTIGYDPDDGGFPMNILHQQQGYVPNGSNITLNVTY